jgi:hypothetical protein
MLVLLQVQQYVCTEQRAAVQNAVATAVNPAQATVCTFPLLDDYILLSSKSSQLALCHWQWSAS